MADDAVNGIAFTLSIELALAADIVIAADDVRLTLQRRLSHSYAGRTETQPALCRTWLCRVQPPGAGGWVAARGFGLGTAGRGSRLLPGASRDNTGSFRPGRTMAGPGGRLVMGEALTIGVRCERGYTIVTAAGEIDIATVTRLRERLFELAANGRPLVVDLDRVRFIDSAGLGGLIGAAKRAAAYGGSLHVVCARPQIRQLFRLTGLDRRIPLARTLDETLQALAAVQATPR
jgi:anti-sigma B factor antagonist